MRRLPVFLAALLPGAALALVGLVPWLLWGRRLRFYRGCLTYELRPKSWPARTWYAGWAGTTFGYVVMTDSVPDDTVFDHELVHVEQFEAACVWGLLAAIALAWFAPLVVALAVWALAPKLQYVGAGIAAVCRGESFYRGNHLEEAAYAARMAPEAKRSCRGSL